MQKFVQKYASVIVPICKDNASPWLGDSRVNVIYNAVDKNIFNKEMPLRPFDTPPLDELGTALRASGLRSHFGGVGQGERESKFDKEPLVVSLSNHKRQQAARTTASPKILFLGGLSKEKGTLKIFEIFEKLLKTLPEAQLLVAGYFDLSLKHFLHPKHYFPAESYKIKVLKVLERIKASVVFLGPIKNVAAVMATSEVIVFPAAVGHFARPVIEAGFMAKPVIASKLSPLDELVIHEETGFLVDIENYDLWVERLFLLLTNKNVNQKMGKNAFDFCSKNFDVKDQIVNIDKVYSNIFSKREDAVII